MWNLDALQAAFQRLTFSGQQTNDAFAKLAATCHDTKNAEASQRALTQMGYPKLAAFYR